jgi:hypothetical protein
MCNAAQWQQTSDTKKQIYKFCNKEMSLSEGETEMVLYKLTNNLPLYSYDVDCSYIHISIMRTYMNHKKR